MPEPRAVRPKRADALRNIESILDAATECLADDPEMSVADIAAAAGVGRITLYGHFKTRGELVDAVFTRTMQRADDILAATDTAGEPREALSRLVAASWEIVHQQRNLLHAAQRELPPERIRGTHDKVLRRMQSVVTRGQRDGVFRTDLPKHWLVTTAFSLMHSAADEVRAGRIKPDDVPALLTKTLLSAFAP